MSEWQRHCNVKKNWFVRLRVSNMVTNEERRKWVDGEYIRQNVYAIVLLLCDLKLFATISYFFFDF